MDTNKELIFIAKELCAGNVQNLILDYLKLHKQGYLTNMSAMREFRGINFGSILKSMEVLEKAGKIEVIKGDTHNGILLKLK